MPPKGRENVKAMKPNSVNQSGVSVLTWNRGSGNKNGDGTLRQIVELRGIVRYIVIFHGTDVALILYSDP